MDRKQTPENGQSSVMVQCPVEIRSDLETELNSNGLRYMLAMYWQGRADKIPNRLLPILEWITEKGLPKDISCTWLKFQPGQTVFLGQDHSALLDVAMQFAQASLR